MFFKHKVVKTKSGDYTEVNQLLRPFFNIKYCSKKSFMVSCLLIFAVFDVFWLYYHNTATFHFLNPTEKAFFAYLTGSLQL